MERDMVDQFHLASKTRRQNRGKYMERLDDLTEDMGGKNLYTQRRQLDEGEAHHMEASTPGTRIRDKNE